MQKSFTPLEIMQNESLKIRNKRFLTGFTLIELIIYSAIICLVLVFASGFAWQIILGNIKAEAQREVEQNANFAMGKITAAITNASGIIQPDVSGEISSLLELNMQDIDKTPTRFEISDGKLTMKESSSPSYSLTSDLVEVTNLKFTNLSYQNTPGTIRVEVTVEYKNPGGREEYTAEVNLENSVSLRK